LNKSPCYFKLRSWTEAVDSAQEFLIGNPRDQMMYTDPRIRAKIKEAQKEQGFSGMTLLEDRLPRTLRAKAWFRLSQCYTNQGYSERAREAAAKAREFCDDSEMSAELTRHSRQIGALEGSQRSRQKKQFRGFFQKLQDRGGYLDEAAQRKVRLEGLTYQQKLRYLEQLDDSDDDEDLRLPVLEDDYSAGRDLDGENSRELSSVKAPDVQTTSNLRAPEADPVTKGIPYCGNDILPQRSEELDCIEAKWRARQRQELVDEAEDEELRRRRSAWPPNSSNSSSRSEATRVGTVASHSLLSTQAVGREI